MKLTHSKGKNGNIYTAIINTLPNGKVVYDFDKTKVHLALHLAHSLGLLEHVLRCLGKQYPVQLLVTDDEWTVSFDKI